MQHKYINLTKHNITDTITGTTIKPSGTECRVSNPSILADQLSDGIPVYGDNPNAVVVGLPDPVEGTIYLVSNLVLNHIPRARTDVYGTGAPYKCRETQTIIGCKGFRQR